MDLYVLDEQLRRVEVVDWYSSLIWTERYSAWGDFELIIRSDRSTRALLGTGTRLVIPKSWRVMEVETVEDTIDDNGLSAFKINGRSWEAKLEDRVTRGELGPIGTLPKYPMLGTPQYVVRTLVRGICMYGWIDTLDDFPFLQSGTLLPLGTIPMPTQQVRFNFDLEPLYTSVKRVCEMYNLGFRFVRDGDASKIYFEVYTGDNRTTMQTTFAPVVFSPELDNLSGTSELVSTANYKNVAYVFGKTEALQVYADNVDPSVTGFERRVLPVDASDIDLEPGPELTAALIQKGKEALAEHRPIIAFDGEIPQNSAYQYGVHYNLGDLVEMRNRDGASNNMRVTEQIFVSDKEGVRSYPTLAIDQLITPGSWYAWNANQVWNDATEYWADA